jgi:hypothetical protein
MNGLQALSPLAGVVAWPILIGSFLFAYRKLIGALLEAALARVQRGDEIKIGIVSIGQAVGPLKLPQIGENANG